MLHDFLYDDSFLFIKIIEYGSFTSAALNMKISHSTLVRRLNRYEKAINITLIRRDNNKFELTSSGQELYKKIAPHFTNLSEDIFAIKNRQLQHSGTLEILAPSDILHTFLNPHLVEFINKYPSIVLHIISTSSIENLTQRSFDLAITDTIANLQNYKVKLISTKTSKLYCTEKYLKKYGSPKTPHDLQKHRIVSRYKNLNDLHLVKQDTGEKTTLKVKPSIITNDELQNLNLINSDEFIVPLYEDEEISQLRFTSILPEYVCGYSNFYTVRHFHSKNTNIDLFIKFISARTSLLK